MKAIKINLLLVFLFLACQSYSQIYIQDLNLNEVKDITYIEVYVNKSYFNNDEIYLINIDYGQNSSGSSTILDKPGGEIIDFRSKIHVINYFEKNGWRLTDINSESQDHSNAKTFYYFKKK